MLNGKLLIFLAARLAFLVRYILAVSTIDDPNTFSGRDTNFLMREKQVKVNKHVTDVREEKQRDIWGEKGCRDKQRDI